MRWILQQPAPRQRPRAWSATDWCLCLRWPGAFTWSSGAELRVAALHLQAFLQTALAAHRCAFRVDLAWLKETSCSTEVAVQEMAVGEGN